MRLYFVAPVLAENDDREASDARSRASIYPIADLILSHVGADPALFALRHVDEGSAAPVEPDSRFGYAAAVRIGDREALRTILAECGDPSSGKWALIRSLLTCRTVYYGSDGQAFVCLPTGAPPISSPDESMIKVEECSHLLVESDWMDGLIED